MKQLDDIVAWFDTDDIDVEKAIAQYDVGIALADEIEAQLQELKGSVTVLAERFDKE